MADDVDRLGPEAAIDQLDELVEVGIEHHPALLHQDAGMIPPGIEGEPRVIAAHGLLLQVT